MSKIQNVLSDYNHRRFAMPQHEWNYYQEWNNVLFLHWKVSYSELRKLVPDSLTIDTFNGQAYVSLVAFTMQKVRPRYLPSIALISDFDEINVRTYINNDNKPGVYFLSIEAAKYMSAWVAKKISGLPYEKSNINRGATYFKSKNVNSNFCLDVAFTIQEQLPEKSALDIWLTERYCLYVEQYATLYRYDIHHPEWDIKNALLHKLDLKYQWKDIELSDTPDVIHYSDGVKVVAWPKERL